MIYNNNIIRYKNKIVKMKFNCRNLKNTKECFTNKKFNPRVKKKKTKQKKFVTDSVKALKDVKID